MSDVKIYAALGAAAALAAATVIQVRAANDKFTFPDGFDKGVQYLTVDKPNKQVHVFYASKDAIAAAKTVPSGIGAPACTTTPSSAPTAIRRRTRTAASSRT